MKPDTKKISDRKNVFWGGGKPDRKKGTSDRKKDVSEGNLMKRSFLTERSFLGENPDKNKASNRKKDIFERNLTQRDFCLNMF